MRGARGGRSVLFTDPDGSHFAELRARHGDFTNPAIDAKIALVKSAPCNRSGGPQDPKFGAVRFLLKDEGRWVSILSWSRSSWAELH
jgi:hypothetical protein